MDSVIKTYRVRVVREPGNEPITGIFYDYAEQEFEVEATSVQSAYQLSHLLCNIKFRGQLRRTFVNENEYFDEKY